MGGIVNSYIHGAGAAFLVDGVTFPNADSGLVRGAGLTGAVDSKLLSYCVWARIITFPTPGRGIIAPSVTLAGATSGFHLATEVSPNGFSALYKGTTTSSILSYRTTNTFVVNTWYCIMGAFDMADTAKRHLYVGDTNELSVSLYTNETIDFTQADWAIAESPDLQGELDCELGPIWYAPGQYIDFSQQANRRKFFSATGKPVNPGSDGSTPTGTAPLIACWVADGAAASTFATNRGTGGNFNIPAALGIATTSPSD